MRIGLLGCGTIGAFVLEAVTRGRAGDVQVVAAASRGSAQSRSLAARYGIPHVHPSELPATVWYTGTSPRTCRLVSTSSS